MAVAVAATLIAGVGGWRGPVTWDEPVYLGTGHRYLDWWADAFPDRHRAAEYFEGYHLHPPLTAYAGAAGDRLVGGQLGSVPASRLATFAAFGVLVGAAAAVAARAWGRRAGLLAALAALGMPRLLGLGQVLNSDVMVAAAWTLTVAVALAALRRPRLAPVVGLCAGLTLASKLSALTLLPLLAVPFLFAAHRRRAVRVLLWSGVLSPVVLVATWPWLWSDPIGRFGDSLELLSDHLPLGAVVFGRLYQEPYAPRWTPPLMLMLTMPLLVLWASTTGAARLVRERSVDAVMVLACATLPLLPFVLADVPRVNGVRTIAPVLPFWAVLAGAGADRLLAGVALVNRRRAVAAAVAALAVTGMLARPFPMDWYGELAGGPKGAAEVFEMEADFWGQSYWAIFPWLNEQLPRRASIVPMFGSGHILRAAQRTGQLRDDLEIHDRIAGDRRLPNYFTQAPVDPDADVVVLPAISGLIDRRLQVVRDRARPLHTATWRGVEMGWVYDADDVRPLLPPIPRSWRENRPEPSVSTPRS